MIYPLAEAISVRDIGAVIGMALFIFWQNRVEKKRKDDTEAAASEQAKQKKDLEQIKSTVTETAETTNVIHKLSNNASGLLKRAKAVALRSLAVNTKDEHDVAAADLAEKEADSHDANQAQIDQEINRRASLALEVKESVDRRQIAQNDQAALAAGQSPTEQTQK